MTRAANPERVLASGRYLELACTPPAPGREHGWEYVRRRNASGVVAVVAVTDADELVLVEQARPALGTTVVELPAGLAGDVAGAEGESFESAARRELLEETGYACAALEHLGRGPSSGGLTDELIDFYRASGLRREGTGGGDASESIEVHRVRLPALREWLARCEARGALVEPKLYAGLFLARIDA